MQTKLEKILSTPRFQPGSPVQIMNALANSARLKCLAVYLENASNQIKG
jgi:hypothetical protein